MIRECPHTCRGELCPSCKTFNEGYARGAAAFDGPDAVAMMMHACGNMRRNGRLTRKPFRNHYCASAEDAPAWDVLVSMGLACRKVAVVPDPTYFVTEAGLAFLFGVCKTERSAARAAARQP